MFSCTNSCVAGSPKKSDCVPLLWLAIANTRAINIMIPAMPVAILSLIERGSFESIKRSPIFNIIFFIVTLFKVNT